MASKEATAQQASTHGVSHVVPTERHLFKALLSANPNYFGTAVGSALPVVTKMAGDTTYEQLDCVSLNPQLNTIEGTVSVKHPFGYGGGLCSIGSREYVRYYVDYGSGWVDAGLTSIAVHDVPDAVDEFGDSRFPLSYAATVQFVPEQRWCHTPVLPRVRGILSWDVIPTGPNFIPVWGNVTECNVQIKPRPPWVIDLIAQLEAAAKVKVKVPPDFAYAEQIPLPGPGPVELSLAELAEAYGATAPAKGTKSAKSAKSGGGDATAVPAHRFGFAELVTTAGAANASPELLEAKIASWAELGLDWAAAAAAINDVDADTSFEELECLGLDNNVDRFVASFLVKRPSGYSGGLCQAGSTEYIAFWADWGGHGHYSYVGTAAVPVHDIDPLPKGGLCYAAVLPVDLTEHRRPCSEPRIVRIRAVLSWNVAPSTTDPDALTTWGDRLDTHVQIAPGPVVSGPAPLIGHLGGISVSQIDSLAGVTLPGAFFDLLGGAVPADPDALGRPCPFARRVAMAGPSFPGLQYRIQVKRAVDVSWSTVTTSFTVSDLSGTVFTSQVPTGDYFTYINPALNVDNLLAEWDTAGDDLWDVKIDILGIPGDSRYRLQLHNTAPTASIDIDVLAGDCGKFPVGTELAGFFTARDDYLASYSIGTAPFAGPVVPSGGLTQTSPAPGDAWSLDTTGMKPCGYIVEVNATGRAIYWSSPDYATTPATVGFCLEASDS